MSETDKLKVEMYDEVVKEKNKEYIELTCRFRETCNDIKNKNKEIEKLKEELEYTIPIVEHNKTITKDLKEIKRLNNIINEFDKWLDVNLFNLEKEKANNTYDKGLKQGMLTNGKLIKNKLQELKEVEKE